MKHSDINGLLIRQSPFTVAETITRFAYTITDHGFALIVRVNNADNAAQQNIMLRPVETILFANVKASAQLASEQPTILIDMPLKAMAWEDVQGKVWLACMDPEWLAARHGLSEKSQPVIQSIRENILALCRSAVEDQAV